jgi:hypothetical protein
MKVILFTWSHSVGEGNFVDWETLTENKLETIIIQQEGYMLPSIRGFYKCSDCDILDCLVGGYWPRNLDTGTRP